MTCPPLAGRPLGRLLRGAGRRPLAALPLLCGVAAAPGLGARAQVPQPSGGHERTVVENIQRQPIGSHTVRDLALPEAFLSRLADEEIRFTFISQHHRVYRDVPEAEGAAPPPPAGAAAQPSRERAPAPVRVHRVRTPSEVLARRRAEPADRPRLRGFRASVLDRAGAAWPLEPPAGAPPPLVRAEAIVAARLARDGLLPTLAGVIEALGPGRFVRPDEDALQALRAAGIPVDLLHHFPVARRGREPAAVVASIATQLAAGLRADSLRARLAAAPFDFVKTRMDFFVASEGGDHEIALVRLQLPRGTYWRGEGAGDGVDIARQLAGALAEVPFLISLSEEHLEGFLRTVEGWPHPERLSVVAEPLEVSQWTQDSGKAGLIGSDPQGPRRPATLVPRFVSRRNDASEFIPGDSYLADGLAEAGHAVIQSPLLFQGGNILAVTDPRKHELVLLLSEAEIHRNVTLGLTFEQVRQAFAIEFGAQRVEVLPLSAFHLDYDLSVRVHEGGVVAFVNDTDAAVRTILALSLKPLREAGVLDEQAAAAARQALELGRDGAFVQLVAPAVWRLQAGRDAYPLSLAQHFAADAGDSAVGNLQRFLLALDILASSAVPESSRPPQPQTRSYLASFKRTAATQARLREQVSGLGWRIVPVPGLAFSEQGLAYLNGIHDRGRYLMPAWGGLFEPLDDQAAAAFRRALGTEFPIVRVRSGESQRRSGAVHCSAAAYAGPPVR